jgi:hypothetical protein
MLICGQIPGDRRSLRSDQRSIGHEVVPFVADVRGVVAESHSLAGFSSLRPDGRSIRRDRRSLAPDLGFVR